MLTRILTAAVALVAFFAVFFANEMIFSLAVVAVGAIMVYEAVKAINPGKLTLISSVVLSVGIFCSMLFAKKY